jgi:hypothetical protein
MRKLLLFGSGLSGLSHCLPCGFLLLHAYLAESGELIGLTLFPDLASSYYLRASLYPEDDRPFVSR